MSENPTVQVTVRLFEALIRLSQAHARLMFRNTVTLQDAVCVILLMENSVWSVGGSNATFADTFPLNHDPMEDFRDDSECDSEFLRESTHCSQDMVYWTCYQSQKESRLRRLLIVRSYMRMNM